MLRIANGSLTKVMFGYVIVTMLLAQCIRSSMVVYGIVVPMLIATCKEMKIHPSKVAYPIALIAVCTCATLPIGGGAGQFAELNGYIESTGYTDYAVQFLDVMKARLPLLIIMCAYAIFFAVRLAPDQPVTVTNDINRAQDTRAPLAPFQEKCGYLIMILTVLGLFFQSKLGVPNWIIAFAGAVLMASTRVLTAKESIDAIPWWIIFVYVGALCMGNALDVTGAGTVIGDFLSGIAALLGNKYLICLMFYIIPFLLTQVMMNNTVLTIFAPIAALACKSMGANPVGPVILVTCAAASAIMSPMATPTIPMSMALGGYDIKTVFKQSLIPAILCVSISVIWVATVFPLY